MSNWKSYHLGELYNVSSGLSKSKDSFGYGETFISFKDVFYNWFLPSNPTGLVNSSEKDQLTCSVLKGDILITRTSETSEEIGMTSVALKDYPKSTFNGFCKRLRIKPDAPIEISPSFIGYLFRSRNFRKTVAQYSTMTTRASLNGDSIKRMAFLFPQIEEQKAIANILTAFDDKIELLQAQNKTLEQTAQTIFKEWIGKYQVGDLPADKAGELPEGWKVGTIYEVLDVQYGFPFKSKLFNENKKGLPLIRIRDIRKGVTGICTEEEYLEEYVVNSGDVLAGMDAIFQPYLWSGQKGLLNQRVCRFIPKEFASRIFVFEFMKPHLSFYEKTKVGTTVIHLGKSDLDFIETIIPSEDVILKFKELSTPIEEKIINNHQQIQTLKQTRDTLLPKLMSGQLRVNDFKENI